MSRFLRGRVVYNNTDFLSSEKSLYCFVHKKRTNLKSINLSLFLKIDVGNVLSSQEVALQVFSPLQVFTTVFGMGTGGLPAIGHQQTCRLLLPIILGFSYTLKIA